MAIAPFVSTEEILIDEYGRHLHGIVVNSEKQGVFDGTDDVTVHSAVELSNDDIRGYVKLVFLMSDAQRRLLACVAHSVGSHLTLSNAVTLASGVSHREGRLSGASIASISSQHVAVSFSTRDATNVILAAVHPKTDAITVQHSTVIVPARATDTCVLASMHQLLVVSVTATQPRLGSAWMAPLNAARRSENTDEHVFAVLSVDNSVPPSAVTWQMGNIHEGTLSCTGFNHTEGSLAALAVFRSRTPTGDCGAFPAPPHATVRVPPGVDADDNVCQSVMA
jgi:hypothetical protein